MIGKRWGRLRKETRGEPVHYSIPGFFTPAVRTDQLCGHLYALGRRGVLLLISCRGRGRATNRLTPLTTAIVSSSHPPSMPSKVAPPPIDSGFLKEDDPSVPRTEALVSFRDILPAKDHPRIAGIESHTARSWCDSRKEVPAPAWLINRLDKTNLETPYKGFSADGHPDPSVYSYDADEGAPVEEASEAATALIDAMSEKQKVSAVRGDILTDDEFRLWSNPELYVNEGEWALIRSPGESV